MRAPPLDSIREQYRSRVFRPEHTVSDLDSAHKRKGVANCETGYFFSNGGQSFGVRLTPAMREEAKQPEETRRERRARLDCAIYLRIASRASSKDPTKVSFVVGMHARIMSGAVWRHDIAETHVAAIGAMLTAARPLVSEESCFVIMLHHAAWMAAVARGQTPAFRPPARRRVPPAGLLKASEEGKAVAAQLERARKARGIRLGRLSLVTLGGDSFTREMLYGLVWNSPVTAVAERFGISDVALRKLCKRRGIPVPARGYWAHLRRKGKSGRTYRKPRLPPL